MTSRWVIGISILCILTVSVLGAAGAAIWIDHEHHHNLSHYIDEHLRRMKQSVEQATISGRRIGMAQALGLTNAHVRDTALGSLAPDNPSLLRELERARSAIQGSIVYVMNQKGMVVACTPYLSTDGMKTLTGHGYDFRPYFKSAMRGQSAVYLALGTTTDERGVYFASPIYSQTSSTAATPVGVLAIKCNIDAIDAIFQQEDYDTALLSPDGIVFSSNRRDWIFKSIEPLSPKTLERIRQSQQFHDIFAETPPAPLPGYRPQGMFSSTRVVNVDIEDHAGQWRILTQMDSLAEYPYMTQFGSVILILLLGALASLALITRLQKHYAVYERRQLSDRAAATYTAIFNATTDAILLLSPTDFLILEANSYGRQLFALSPEDPIPLPTLEDHGEDAPAPRLHKILHRVSESPAMVECKMVSREGRAFWSEVTLRRSLINGELRILAVIRDIEERKVMQQEFLRSERLAAVGTLSAGVAHEFNNINVSILGYAQLGLESTPPDDIIHKYLSKIEEAARRARGVTTRLLDFSSPRQHSHTYSNLTQLVESTVSLIAPELKQRGIVISQHFEPTPELQMDAELIGQVALNLLINAMHAMTGSAECQLSVATGHDEKVAWFSIGDTGCGIPPEEVSRIFTPFYSTKGEHASSGSVMNQVRGTGLGLSVSHTIISDHGGAIELESEPEKGTVFRVSLPLSATQQHPDAPGKERHTEGRIGIFHEEQDTSRLLEVMLKRQGYQVRIKDHLEAVWGWVLSREVDLLILEISTSKEAEDLLKRIDDLPKNQRPPVVTISDLPLSVVQKDGLGRHVGAIITKPFSQEQIKNAIAQARAARAGNDE